MSELAASFVTKSDYAYNRVRKGILSGEFEPGTVLQQAILAKAIGISTTPLREAMRRLLSEGLVELDAHRDARVTPLTAEEARDLLEIRLSLDPLAASLAAQRRTREDIQRMRQRRSHAQPLLSNPSVAELGAHRAFHQALYEASHNELLISTLNGLWDKSDRYRRLGLETPRTQEERDEKDREHHALVEAIALGDSEGAAAVMLRHINTSLGAKVASGLTPPIPAPTLQTQA